MKKAGLFLMTVLVSVLTFAQQGGTGGDGSLDVKVKTNDEAGPWYMSPFLWVVAAAIFILLLVALLRGSNRRTN